MSILRRHYFISIFSIIVIAQAPIISNVFAQVNVERITNENAHSLIKKGPDAIGGIGDVFLSNGVLCAVFSDIEHEGEFSANGGILIDLGFCDRADDHLTSIQDLLDGGRNSPMDVYRLELDQTDKSASVITYAQRLGVELITRYTLDEEKPTELAITKRVKVTDKELADFSLYSSVWFNYHSLETYVHSTRDASSSRGFNNIDFVTRGVSAIREAASDADVIVFIAPTGAEQDISYGWQLKSAQRIDGEDVYSLPAFVLSDEESSVFLILVDDFYIGDGSNIGLLQLPQIPLLSLADDEYIQIEEVIYVGDNADVASITDQLLNNAQMITAVIDVNSALHLFDENDNPVTFVRPDRRGYISFELTAGQYRLEHHGKAGSRVNHDLVVKNTAVNLGELKLPEVGRLNLPKGHAMRLVFKGLDKTEDPNFDDRLSGYTVSGDDDIFETPVVNQIFLAGVDSDIDYVELAAGRYRVYATRGPEHGLSQSDILIANGKVSTLEVSIPQHTVNTPGYIASDLHVHAEIGFDNTFSSRERIRSFVAEQGEVMVSSEHDVPVDYSPMIKEMGLSDQITSIAAVEMTSTLPSRNNKYTGGHINFFPVHPKPLEYRKGMLNHEDKRLREILHDFEHHHPGSMSQLNHARQRLALSDEDLPRDYEEMIDNGAYLEHLGEAGKPYNPHQDFTTHPNSKLLEPDPKTGKRDIDFDAMEIINPGGEFHDERIVALRRDWLSFLQQGHRITGTANSDSHHANQQVSIPRTMVGVKGDNVVNFNQTEFINALKHGNAYGTTGPMVDILLSDDINSANMGQTFQGSQARLSVIARSVDWIPIDTIRVQINGQTIIDMPIEKNKPMIFDLEFTKDSFVTIEIAGEPSAEYEIIYPEIKPYAFTNPIYVDFDSNGDWQAPGHLPILD